VAARRKLGMSQDRFAREPAAVRRALRGKRVFAANPMAAGGTGISPIPLVVPSPAFSAHRATETNCPENPG